MNASTPVFHADARSRERLADGGEKVLLLGGYLGYPNFGDILQLKGAIAWHRSHSHREPVLLCDAASIPDPAFPDRLRAWFGVEGLLFWSLEPVDLEPIGWTAYRETHHVPHLHVYGGGFLTTSWGGMMLAVIEALHRVFGVGHYVLSGQQVQPALLDALKQHFDGHPPLLAGGRDPTSVETLQRCGVHAFDSFDDSADMLRRWADNADAGNDSGTDALIHLNLSMYARAGDAAKGRSDCVELLNALVEHLAARCGHRAPKVTLLQAYNDLRLDVCLDSLAVVQQLEDAFPFTRFDVIDLSRLALGLSGDQPLLVPLPRPPIALACSYHVTLLCAMMGIPCYLHARNAYYTQKKNGFGMDAADFPTFLRNPKRLDLTPRLDARCAWLERLADAYAQPARERQPAPEPAPASSPRRPWTPKTLDSEKLRQEMEASWMEQERRITELHDENTRLASGWESQRNSLHELEREAQRLGEGWTAQHGRIQELEKVKDDLWNELQQATESLRNVEADRAALTRALVRFENHWMPRLLRKMGFLRDLARGADRASKTGG